jgi:hypothetical protein
MHGTVALRTTGHSTVKMMLAVLLRIALGQPNFVSPANRLFRRA